MAGFGTVVGVSSLYETEPIGPEQPDFLNAAVLLSVELAPETLLEELLDLERAEGRVRRERWGPRVLDLDILWIDGCAVDTPALKVPHPSLAARAFALLPLLEVAPAATDPRSGRPLSEARADLKGQRIRVVEGPRWSAGYSPKTRGSRS